MKKLKENRLASFITIIVIYILAIITGVLVYRLLNFNWWINLLLADIAATILTFIFSLILKNLLSPDLELYSDEENYIICRGSKKWPTWIWTKDNFDKAVSMFKDEWRYYAENGFSKEDVEFAKDYLIASYNLRFASILGIADMLVMQQKMGLGLDFLNKRNDYVKQVNVEAVNKAVKKYFNDNMLQAQIGSFN